MKNAKSAAMGFVAGALCMVSVTAFADSYPEIMAKLFNDVVVKVDGEYKEPPADQPILNYNGYAYVPLRYVSETLGATVNFDIPTRTIDIQSDKRTYVKEVPVEKIVYVDKDDPNYDKVEKKKAYEELPSYTKIFLNVENDNNYGCQIVPSECTLVVDGEEVPKYNVVRLWDQSWSLSDIQYDDEREGFLLFDLIDEDWETATLEVKLLSNEEGKEEVHTFDIKHE